MLTAIVTRRTTKRCVVRFIVNGSIGNLVLVIELHHYKVCYYNLCNTCACICACQNTKSSEGDTTSTCLSFISFTYHKQFAVRLNQLMDIQVTDRLNFALLIGWKIRCEIAGPGIVFL